MDEKPVKRTHIPLDYAFMWQELYRMSSGLPSFRQFMEAVERGERDRGRQKIEKERLIRDMDGSLSAWVSDVIEYGPGEKDNYPRLNTVIFFSQISARYDLPKQVALEVIKERFLAWLEKQ